MILKSIREQSHRIITVTREFGTQTPEDEKGVRSTVFRVCLLSLIHRYGSYLRLLKDDAVQDLTLLMKHIKVFLSSLRVKTSSELGILSRDHACINVQWVDIL